MVDTEDQKSEDTPEVVNPLGVESTETETLDQLDQPAVDPSPGPADAVDAAAVAPTAWEKGVGIVEHLAALKAQHAAELETTLLREQVKRLEIERELAETRAQIKSGHPNSATSDSSTTEPATRAARRQREKEWDALSYVPVVNYRGNPFRGPDPGVQLPNLSLIHI